MESLKEKNLRKAFKRIKEDNLFLLQKIESLEERVSTQENMLKESFELLREQIEIYKAESSIANLNQKISSNETDKKPKVNTKLNEKTKPSKKYDDLTKIEGIGPVIKKVLENNNISTFKQLSNTSEKKLIKILEDNDLQQHSPETWPKQAELAQFKMWNELKDFQDSLKGGR